MRPFFTFAGSRQLRPSPVSGGPSPCELAGRLLPNAPKYPQNGCRDGPPDRPETRTSGPAPRRRRLGETRPGTRQNRNKPERERQGARCGWVPCLPNFLPGYQGGASRQGAFLASVTTDGRRGYQGGAQWPGAFLASRFDQGGTPTWRLGSLGIYRFFCHVDARSWSAPTESSHKRKQSHEVGGGFP